MKTQHDIEKEQEARASLPVQEQQVYSAQTFPQPPRQKGRRWVVISAIAVMLVLVLSVGALFIPGVIQHPGGQGQVTPTSPATQVKPTAPTTSTPGSDLTPAPVPGIVFGPQACPNGIGDPAHWNAIIGTNNGKQHVETVSCANIMDNRSLQALVTVRHSDASSTLDVYVFQDVTSAKPAQIFKLPGLVKGNAMISGYNTVMTAEVDANSTLNAGKPVAATTPDLFREFDWSASQGNMVQTAFPGIFPDLTRYQAEADQTLVNKGQDTWKNDPQAVAKALAVRFLNWNRTLTTNVLSGGGPKDVYATVQVQEVLLQGPPSQGPSVFVTLSRLGGNTHNMWVAIAVQDGSALTLTNIQPRSLVASPVKFEGKGSAFENTIGLAYILDHQYTKVGQAIVTGPPGYGMGNLPYSTKVSYDLSFKQGPQEGIAEVALTSPMGDAPAIMVKVLLDPQPRVAVGPVSGPVALQKPGYWESVLGIGSSTGSVGTVSYANLKGDPSLQALVPVYYTNGKPVAYYVYDNITNVHPVQLPGMPQTKSAVISGASTIITQDVDKNSSDIYREYQWSGKTGTFAQVAFPGLYPDLTRWQAELDQAAVTMGSDSWKLNAVQTTQHALKFLNRSATNPLRLLSGGGPHDLTATVQAAPYPQGGGVATTTITLKRLEGNTNGGIWEITAVQSKDFGITSPPFGPSTLIKSPVTVKGFGWQFEGEVGNVVIQDHLYTEIGREIASGTGGFTKSSFTVDVPYTSSFQGGAQEGIVVLYENSGGGIPVVAMEKVLISA